MQIQEAIRAAQEGALIRRASWHGKDWGTTEKLSNFPHCVAHLIHAQSDDGDECWVMKEQFGDGAFSWEHKFTAQDIMAEDWEVIDFGCSCIECSPELPMNSAPLQVGDLVERYPCSGFRVIWAVTEITPGLGTSKRVRGQVYRLFDGDRELDFDVEQGSYGSESHYPKIRINERTVYQDWIHSSEQSANLHDILLGLPHNQSGTGSSKEYRLTGEYLEALRKHETKLRVSQIETMNQEAVQHPGRSRAVAATAKPESGKA